MSSSNATRPTLAQALHHVNALLERFYRCMRRSGQRLHPLETIRLMHDGAVMGGYDALPDDLVVLDRVISEAYIDTQLFLDAWYGNEDPVYLKAERLSLSRSAIYELWKQHLGYIAGALRARGAVLGE